MRPIVKFGSVIAGYVLAVALAVGAVASHMFVANILGTQASGGMAAFGDSLLFLAVFGIAAVPPTAAGLFFLRPWLAFWRVFSVAALAFALTSFAAFIVFAINSHSALSGVAFFRIILAPLFTLAFLLAVLFAPNRNARIALLVAILLEASGFACWLLTCLFHNLTHA